MYDVVQKSVVVVKSGGSALGTHDTTLEGLVELQQQGESLVLVHGGAKATSELLAGLGISTRPCRVLHDYGGRGDCRRISRGEIDISDGHGRCSQ